MTTRGTAEAANITLERPAETLRGALRGKDAPLASSKKMGNFAVEKLGCVLVDITEPIEHWSVQGRSYKIKFAINCTSAPWV